jgi:DNA repair photolyase
MSGVTDPYQPRERELEITRGCIEVLAEFLNPVSIITKNHLVTRDIDLLGEMASVNAARVNLSVTTLDADLARTMEPRTTRPQKRLEAIRKLSQAGVRVGVMVAPIIPGLTDHEIPSILKQASQAGAVDAGYTVVRLPHGVKDLFSDWLEHHFPDRKDKVLNRIKSMREGKLNDPRFGHRMGGGGTFADQIRNIFKIHTDKYDLNKDRTPLSTRHFRPGRGSQLNMFHHKGK